MIKVVSTGSLCDARGEVVKTRDVGVCDTQMGRVQRENAGRCEREGGDGRWSSRRYTSGQDHCRSRKRDEIPRRTCKTKNVHNRPGWMSAGNARRGGGSEMPVREHI